MQYDKYGGKYGGRGEVVNTPDCGSGIREFDSRRSPQIKILH